MENTEIAIETLKWGMGGAVLVVIFWKFIPSLFEFLKRDQNDNAFTHPQITSNGQRIDRLEREYGKRIERLDTELNELRKALSEVRVAVEVSNAILKRIEDSISK